MKKEKNEMRGKNTHYINFRFKRSREPAGRGPFHCESEGPEWNAWELFGRETSVGVEGEPCRGQEARGGVRCRKLLEVTLEIAGGGMEGGHERDEWR